jgi:hypothetical protein
LLLGLTNFDEYDQIFLDFAYLPAELGQQATAQTINLRMVQLNQWVRRGNTLVVLSVMPVWMQPLGQYLNFFEPFSGLGFQSVEGSRMEACGPREAFELLTGLIEQMSYSFVITGDDLKPLLRVRTANKSGPTQVVAGLRQLDAGQIIYLPKLSGNSSKWVLPLAAIQKLAAVLTRREPDELPGWVHQFRSESELAALAEIDVLEVEVGRIRTEIARHQLSIDDAIRLKQLIAGSGQGFAEAAANALKELGFRVVEGQHPRADLVVSDGSRIAAVEVKGVEGPIGEKHLRQLWAWMAEIDNILSMPAGERSKEQVDYATIIEKLETPVGDFDCKGLLIVGTFRATPLDQRSEPDLPDPVQRRLGSTDTCILTGLQLLGLVLAGRQDPKVKPLFVQELMSTRGRLNRVLDWTEFLAPAVHLPADRAMVK